MSIYDEQIMEIDSKLQEVVALAKKYDDLKSMLINVLEIRCALLEKEKSSLRYVFSRKRRRKINRELANLHRRIRNINEGIID